jgi:hypothetical protein
MSVYTRIATCSKGHPVRLSFEWKPDRTADPEKYSKPCPVSGCEGLVTGKLPIGAEEGSAQVSNGTE